MIKTKTLSQTHPQYDNQKADWILLRDSYGGQRTVKLKKTAYLPYTAGQIEDGVRKADGVGLQSYNSYLLRARYPNFIRQAVQTAIGMMHSHPPKISLPKELEKISTSKGETLDQLLRRINVEQLITGRIGLLLDIPSGAVRGKDLPYIATYASETIINWDDGDIGQIPQSLNLVVLDESEHVRIDGFSWEKKEKYRVLSIGSFEHTELQGLYTTGEFEEESFNENDMMAPSFRGRGLQEIPFVFINSCDLIAETDDPPLLDLANLCMTIYRGEADYRQNLFMQGQDTFVTIGANLDEDEKVRVGAGARLDLPVGGDAKFVGVQSDGLEEQRISLENDRSIAGSSGAQTIDTTSRERESGDSLRIRVSARTADLNQIANTAAKGLEDLLKIAAEWIGADPREVSVEPNLEFADSGLTGQSMVEMQTARNLGYPISARSLHKVAYNKGLTTASYEQEIKEAKEEENTVFKKADTGDRNPNQTGDNNE